jgi:hypothetical protein
MPLFGRRHQAPAHSVPPEIPGLADSAAAQSWQPMAGRPFGPKIVDVVHDITRAMYGVPRRMPHQGTIGATMCHDAFRASIGGRTVIVANARTYIEPGLFQGGSGVPVVAVCAVELATIAPLTYVQPRQFPHMMAGPESSTGNPAFDGQFRVTTVNPAIGELLTPDVQQRIMARDDWVFWLGDYLLACISKGKFHTVSDVTSRIAEVLALVTAIPDTVLPSQVDHSADDLTARVSRLNGVEDALALLQDLTPADREQLARSNTPLAAFADVQTPEEALARFGSLDPQHRMQLLAMFSRVDDARGDN